MQSGKHLGKVILKAEEDTEVKVCSLYCLNCVDPANVLSQVLPSPSIGAAFAADASYLIVGGLGGLGRAICNWMAGKKCKNIILVSRSGMKASGAQSLMDELETLGVMLKIYACDVSNAEELGMVLKQCHIEMPPIRGVIQSAMVIKVSHWTEHRKVLLLTEKGLPDQQNDGIRLPRCLASQGSGHA